LAIDAAPEASLPAFLPSPDRKADFSI